MSRTGFVTRILLAVIAAAGLVVLLVLLWGLLPPLPQIGRSTTGPSAATTAKQLVELIIWVLAVVLILRLLLRLLRSITQSRSTVAKAADLRIQRILASQPAHRKSPRLLAHLATTRSYPLIVHHPNETRPTEISNQAPETIPPTASPGPRPDAMTRSISVLGPLAIQGTRQRGRRLRSLTAQMLLYLVLHPEGATVDELADVLLPETDPEQSRGRLWQSASEARRILGDGFRRDDDGRYSLDRVAVHIDLDDLNLLLGDRKQPADADHTTELESALALFRGDPLAEVDWSWAAGHIRHLRATYVDLIEQVGRARLLHGDPRGSLQLAERGLDVDKLNEALWRLAMEADSAVGLRNSVSRRYAQLGDLLDRELGLEPAAETRALYLSLLGQG